jgi:uncharacterized protein YndB with AHSA1/START domain
MRASVRREVRSSLPAEQVWKVIGDPSRVAEWFGGIDSATVDGSSRTIMTGAGIAMLEEILTNDSLQKRFQYRIASPLFREHLSTIDVFDLGDDTTLVSYSADADPASMALVIAGAAGAGLNNLRRVLEAEA